MSGRSDITSAQWIETGERGRERKKEKEREREKKRKRERKGDRETEMHTCIHIISKEDLGKLRHY